MGEPEEINMTMGGKLGATVGIILGVILGLIGPVWAVHVGEGAPLMLKCCDRSNGGRELIVLNNA